MSNTSIPKMPTVTLDEILSVPPFAFPTVIPHDYKGAFFGMTLRDYFAGQALFGLVLDRSYNLADVMMKARQSC